MNDKAPRIPLPKNWPTQVKSAMLHVISLAQFATADTRGWAADSGAVCQSILEFSERVLVV